MVRPILARYSDACDWEQCPYKADKDRSACVVLESQLSPADPALLMLHGTSATHVDSPKRQPVLLSSAGLTRNEPLVFHLKDTATMPYLQPIRIFSKSVRAKPSWTEHHLCRRLPQSIDIISALSPLSPLMAEAGADEPDNQDEQAEEGAERPRRCPRSRVRADGTRRRTQAEIEARRKAKREGTGYWAGKAGGRSHSGRPPLRSEEQL